MINSILRSLAVTTTLLCSVYLFQIGDIRGAGLVFSAGIVLCFILGEDNNLTPT